MCSIYGSPRVDLFATRINDQLPVYVSWRPDPGACATDAFSISWANEFWYAFPPFSLVGRVLQKLVVDQATMMVIVPIWPTRTWFSRALRLVVETPRILPRDCLGLPQDPSLVHPLADKLRLVALILSGDPSMISAFRQRLRPFSSPLGDPALNASMGTILEDGCSFVSGRKWIQFVHLLRSSFPSFMDSSSPQRVVLRAWDIVL